MGRGKGNRKEKTQKVREKKVGVRDLGARLNVREVEQPLVVAVLYADDIVLLAESEGMFQRIVDEFDKVCKRRKLKVNAGKSKVMVLRAREHTTDFAKPYRVGSEAILRCKIWLGKEKMEVNEFKYWHTLAS